MALLFLACATLLFYLTYTIYSRLYLSPISHIPGPTLAAITRLYEAYYDVYLGGQYTFKIISLHAQYGPIIRISPWEIHISDPSFYDTLYASTASGHKRDKYSWFTKSFGLDDGAFATTQHELHRVRRAALAPYFSMGSVRRLQPVVQERIDVLLKRLSGFRDTGEVVMLSWAYAALTNDIVMIYCFGRCDHRLEAKDFDPSYRDAAFFGSTAGNFLKHALWIHTLMKALPMWAASALHPAMASFVAQKHDNLNQIKAILAKPNLTTNDSQASSNDIPTIFHSILYSKLPPQEKTPDRLTDEAQTLTMAGTLTTSWVLDVITFWLLRQPSTLAKLKHELRIAIPSPDMIGTISLPVLEGLPYLNAVMKEGFRLTYGVSTRLARIDPEQSMVFVDGENRYVIPPDTPVSMTNVQLHHDERFFPSSKTFSPERWLDGKAKDLDKYLVNFCAGSRQCLGINLARAELYLGLAAIWRVWGSGEVRGGDDVGWMELWETDEGDVEIERDAFLPIVKKGSEGIRVKVHS